MRITELRYERIPEGDPARASGYLWRTTRDWSIEIRGLGAVREWTEPHLTLETLSDGTAIADPCLLLTIRAGYCWDGPSVPMLARFRWWQEASRDFIPPSCVHDAGYQLMREGALPPFARSTFDSLLRRLSEDMGMGFARRWLDWLGVRLGASWAARATPETWAVARSAKKAA